MWHYPGIGVSVAEGSLLTSSGSSLGIDAALSAGYTMRIGHLLIGTGVEASMTHTAFRIDDAHHEMPGSVDRDGYEFTFVYDIAGRRDAVTCYQIGIPLRVGALFNPVYFLVGASVVVPLYSSGAVSADVTTYGDYPHFLDPFTSMPEHQYFSSTPQQWHSPLHPKTDVRLSAEVGYLFHRMQSKAALAVGLFASYGLLNSCQPSGTPLIEYPAAFTDGDMLSPLQAHHLLDSPDIKQHSLRVGVRLTVFFPHKQKSGSRGPCLCMPFN